MKILIHITSNSELITYEAIALAFLLASFDNEIQLQFDGASIDRLKDKNSRLYGMIQSIHLYDIPKAWAAWENTLLYAQLDNVIKTVLTQDYNDKPNDEFDSVLCF
ncbi:MAG: hypothetical protein Q4G13_08740 [Moraxella sp.]|nr:hypothetical protein [Moraxella sp.]